MQYCAKCGKEIMDEHVCLNCGCEIGSENSTNTLNAPKSVGKKKVLMTIAIVIVVIVAILVGLSVWNNLRVEEVKEQLAGKRFSYMDSGLYSASLCYFEFDAEANCTYYYFYTNVMAEGVEYQRDYEIKFEDGMVFLVCGIDTYEIQYDKYGEIEGLYDISRKELYN